MKAFAKVMMSVALGLLSAGLIVSCASSAGKPLMDAEPPQDTGFLHGYYQYLQPGPEGGASMRWLKSGVDFAKYNKIMLDSVIFYFAEDSEHKGIDGYEMKDLADECNLEVVRALTDTYSVVDHPGPDVVRIRFAITDIKQSWPAISTITSVVPVGLGINILKKGATGSWTGSGATTAEFMALDSQTNEVVAVAQDDRSAAFTERFTKWGSTEDAFKFWGQRIKLFMDLRHAMAQ